MIGYYVSKQLLGDEEEDMRVHTRGSAKAPQKTGHEDASNQEEEEAEEIQIPENLPEDAIFIPLWLPTEKPRYFYKGSDPEWKNYSALSNDQQKCQKVRGSRCRCTV